MKVIAKFVNDRFDSKNFSIFKDANKEQFKKLQNLIYKLEEEGFKTSLRLNEKYKNTIYLSFMDKYDTLGDFEQGKKYRLSFRDLVPNTKGYVNFKLIDYEEIEEVEEFGDLL